MLSFETMDNWAISATFKVGADSATFTGTQASAIETMLALAAWLNDAGRAWFGVAVFSWSASRHTVNSGARFTLAATSAFSITAVSADWVARMGLDVGGPWSSQLGNSAGGTVAPLGFSLHSDDPTCPGNGGISGFGALAARRASTASRRPVVEAIETPTDNARRESIVATCSNPRAAWLHDQNYSRNGVASALGWNRYSIFAITASAIDGIRWRVGFEATR